MESGRTVFERRLLQFQPRVSIVGKKKRQSSSSASRAPTQTDRKGLVKITVLEEKALPD